MITAHTTAMDWQESFVSDCVTPFEVERGKKVLAREYKSAGNFPVVDQGQQLVAGYADDESAVIRDELPLVVFGDHTRVFKFVDFPFVVGADGTKLLKPKPELDPKFFYFACLKLDIPTRGYNRHFKILREQTIRYPEKSEQEKIAAVLWKIQKAVEIEDAIVRNARDLKKSLLCRLFTVGLRGEPLKETEIGSLPQSWDVLRISEIARISSGGTPDRTNSSYWQNGTIPWVKTGEIDYCVIRGIAEKITEAGLRNSAARLYPKGTLLIAMYGQGVTRGRVAILGIEAAINQACGAFLLNGGVITEYLYHYLTFAYERLRNLAHGANQQNLNARLVSQLQFPKPSEDEQREIANVLQSVDRKIDIHESKKGSLQDLFKTMLHKLMTAQTRVNNLDIDTSDVATADKEKRTW